MITYWTNGAQKTAYSIGEFRKHWREEFRKFVFFYGCHILITSSQLQMTMRSGHTSTVVQSPTFMKSLWRRIKGSVQDDSKSGSERKVSMDDSNDNSDSILDCTFHGTIGKQLVKRPKLFVTHAYCVSAAPEREGQK